MQIGQKTNKWFAKFLLVKIKAHRQFSDDLHRVFFKTDGYLFLISFICESSWSYLSALPVYGVFKQVFESDPKFIPEE